jgi:hypothetical protein
MKPMGSATMKNRLRYGCCAPSRMYTGSTKSQKTAAVLMRNSPT